MQSNPEGSPATIKVLLLPTVRLGTCLLLGGIILPVSRGNSVSCVCKMNLISQILSPEVFI